MKRVAKRAALAWALLLAGCASAPAPPGAVVDQARFGAAAVPGATRAAVQAALGPTHTIGFDSGYQVWLYQTPRAGGRYAELVLLFDRSGVLVRSRRREPD